MHLGEQLRFYPLKSHQDGCLEQKPGFWGPSPTGLSHSSRERGMELECSLGGRAHTAGALGSSPGEPGMDPMANQEERQVTPTHTKPTRTAGRDGRYSDGSERCRCKRIQEGIPKRARVSLRRHSLPRRRRLGQTARCPGKSRKLEPEPLVLILALPPLSFMILEQALPVCTRYFPRLSRADGTR